MAYATKLNHPEIAHEAPQQFIKLSAVKELTTLSTSEIYRRIATGNFPKQVMLGPKSSVWVMLEIFEWQRAQIEAREGQKK
ncbi:helix-turn-helix transcriptional regulator [Aquipseudomonas ullengensis]|uniref:AlpA family phage regulatory protein n=1 Tax=Aquipseudomonas ullengensis TaxID=2759166 RepID=A0A7W4QFN3_9GAMM|nr:AlpA family phage regulatory protein [Pseudomonas ullengensis]MBB2496833.1 AlpA family phage regulatory protein [Pseudomonas ullengensis]